jgi:hypothetical protein
MNRATVRGALLLNAAEARPYNINALVEQSLSEVLPRQPDSATRVFVDLDITLPRLPLLIDPFRHALSKALELCLQVDEPSAVVVRTAAQADIAVVSIERHPLCYSSLRRRRRRHSRIWHDLGTMGDLDLLVGQQVLRALGGRLWLIRGKQELRAVFELPLANQSQAQPALGPVSVQVTRPTVRRPRMDASNAD